MRRLFIFFSILLFSIGANAQNNTLTLQYQDNNGAWLPLPPGATVTATSFSFTNPGLPIKSGSTVSVRDANNPSVTATVTFNVIAAPISQGWNSADTSSTVTLSNNNQTAASTSAVQGGSRGVAAHSTGKYCFDTVLNTVTPNAAVGVSNVNFALAGTIGSVPMITSSPAGQSFKDSAGNTYTIVQGTSAGAVYKNGAPLGSTGNVIELADVNNVIWAENSAGTWYSWNGSNWIAGAAPTLTGPTPSSPMGLNANSIAFYPAKTGAFQSIFYNGVEILNPTGSSIADVNGDPVTICDDLDAQKEWVSTPVMRSTAGIVWNSAALTAQNPATGTGGLSFSGLICPCLPTFDTQDSSTQTTINTVGPLSVALPAGFLVWQPSTQIIHHPFVINLGQNTLPANDNDPYKPVRFERQAQ